MKIQYEENQFFHPWVYIVGCGAVLISFISTLIAFSHQDVSLSVRGFLPVLQGMVFVFILNILFLQIRIENDVLYVRLGYAIPMGWKRIPLSEIKEARVVTYKPIRDAGGWGIRFGRYEGKPCRFWNARGNRGVLLRTQKHQYIIGSQQPEIFFRFLEEARELLANNNSNR